MWWSKNRLENAFSMFEALKKLTRQIKFDVIEMPECGAEGLFVNHFLNENTFIRFHSPAELIMPFYDVSKPDTRLCSLIEKAAVSKKSHLISCSAFLANEMIQTLKINRPVKVIPNGIDLELFDASEKTNIRKKFNISDTNPMIFFSGRMEKRKGIHLCKEIIETVLKKHEVSFVFAGQDLFGYMQNQLLPYLESKSLKGSIHYLGKLSHTDIRSCLAQTDIFLLPSLWENCPYSCLEAMAAGKAVVCSDHGGMSEIINDQQNGLLASNNDPAAYIKALELFIENDDLRNKTGTAARITIEKNYNDTLIAKLSVDYYQACLRNHEF